jgi:uncharacterized protein (TIGR00266 family)
MLEKSWGGLFFIILLYLLVKKWYNISANGTIAQWESICLTCKGSGVQVPLVPPFYLKKQKLVLATSKFLSNTFLWLFSLPGGRNMKYEIKGLNLPYVEITLERGEKIHTERGGMSWMSETMEMKTNAGGSIGKALSRAFSGESMFQNTYTATKEGDMIAISSSFPGQILAIDVSEQPIIAQKRAFLAREESVDMSIFFQRKLGAGFFGGEGFIMQKFTGRGIVFLEIDGSLIEKELAKGEILILDTGFLAAMTETVTFEIVTVKGIGNALFGGEGLFNTKVTGPGKIWIQSCPMSKLAGLFNVK